MAREMQYSRRNERPLSVMASELCEAIALKCICKVHCCACSDSLGIRGNGNSQSYVW